MEVVATRTATRLDETNQGIRTRRFVTYDCLLDNSIANDDETHNKNNDHNDEEDQLSLDVLFPGIILPKACIRSHDGYHPVDIPLSKWSLIYRDLNKVAGILQTT